MAELSPSNGRLRGAGAVRATSGDSNGRDYGNEWFSAWGVAFGGAIGLLAFLVLTRPRPYREILAFVPDGILVTFQVTIESILLALVIGLFTGLGRLSANRLIRGIASLYVEVIRGIPLLVQLFYLYYALAALVRLPDILTAVLAMAICYGAYLGEIVRAGIESIPRGQMEAARSLGMTHVQAMRHVILPQAVRTILPPVGNEFVALLKDSSLVSILAVADLLRRGREYASETFTYFETYTVIALVYLIITLFFSKMIALLERRFSAGK